MQHRVGEAPQMADQAVLAERLAVVGGDDDEEVHRVVAAPGELVEQPTEGAVHGRDLCVVERAHGGRDLGCERAPPGAVALGEIRHQVRMDAGRELVALALRRPVGDVGVDIVEEKKPRLAARGQAIEPVERQVGDLIAAGRDLLAPAQAIEKTEQEGARQMVAPPERAVAGAQGAFRPTSGFAAMA